MHDTAQYELSSQIKPLDPHAPINFLVVRRDNIGDLVCTTPVFQALRERFPGARIYALTNTYNLPVLCGNPFVDGVFAYMKAKHRSPGTSLWSVYLRRFNVIRDLRRARIDYAVLAACGFVPRALSFARLAKPKHIVGYVPAAGRARGIDIPIRYAIDKPLHEVEDVFRILAPLGIRGTPPPLFIAPQSEEVVRARTAFQAQAVTETPIAVHISARKPSNRWPIAHFTALIRMLHAQYGRQILLLWSPGDNKNPHHPGDDDNAAAIMQATRGIPIAAYPTHTLEQLIGALSLCDIVICSDGGAMHIAAALRKSILCFFGDSDATRWRPWGVPYVLLQKPSLNAADISVDETLAAFATLHARKQSGQGA